MKYFDKIICINLIDRDDKYEYSTKLFKKINIDVEYYRPAKHITSGRIGCFESHIKVIEYLYNNKYNNILIFEDDVKNTECFNDSNIKKNTNFLSKNNWCEYFQFGYAVLPHDIISFLSAKNLDGNTIIKYNGNCTHAYSLNYKGMERILKTWKKSLYEKNMDLDLYYKEIFKENGACVCPILFDQNFCMNSG